MRVREQDDGMRHGHAAESEVRRGGGWCGSQMRAVPPFVSWDIAVIYGRPFGGCGVHVERATS